jgi:N-acetylmuramoyl-L-alanine amidase
MMFNFQFSIINYQLSIREMAVMTYKLGSTGTVVKQIQRVLKVYPDGRFGPITQEALMAWQREHKLTADGIAGPRTLVAMGISAVVSQQDQQGPLDSVTACYGGKVLTLRKSKRRIDEIIVHCTATPEGQPRTVEQIRAQHKAQGWSDIGYHILVTLDGQAHLGRDMDISGAHAEGHNSHSIGVCYVGGVENRPGVAYKDLKAKDTRTEAQKATLMALLMDLRKLYPKARIIGHRDVSHKACPSFDAKTAYQRI